MDIGIIGSGEMGRTLGQRWTLKEHKVLFGSRNPDRVNKWIKTNDIKATSGTYNEASKFGKIVLLATSWADTKNALTDNTIQVHAYVMCQSTGYADPHRAP